MAVELLIVALGCVAVAGVNAYARTVEARTVRAMLEAEKRLETLAIDVESAIATLRAERKALDSWRSEADSRLISLERRVEGLGLKMSGR